ncbi:MAG: peptide chain release factor N(5)-glutamine methyltransferase [Flavobacteriales bacterium]
MRITDNRVVSVLAAYVQRLSSRYERQESLAMARIVFEDRLGWDRARLELAREEPLSESELLKVYLPIERLEAGEPLQYVIGRVRFHGMDLAVAPGVLIPRPETEELVEHILRSGIGPSCIVDIGTGSGAIALTLKKKFPHARVIGIDVSVDALEQARSNGEALGINVEWLHADVMDASFELPEECDLVVSNPPYIPSSERGTLEVHVRDHEPAVALFVDDGDPVQFHRAIAAKANSRRCTIWFEGHRDHAVTVADVLTDMGWAGVQVWQDISGADRFITATR